MCRAKITIGRNIVITLRYDIITANQKSDGKDETEEVMEKLL